MAKLQTTIEFLFIHMHYKLEIISNENSFNNVGSKLLHLPYKSSKFLMRFD